MERIEISSKAKRINRGRFPSWLRRSIPPAGRSGRVRQLLADLHLETVCSSANCPNLSECFARGTATFMILGDRCTRSCRFCAVGGAGCLQPVLPNNSGAGKQHCFQAGSATLPLRDDEPEAVADACVRLGLKHVVITSVTRDDLPDGGAEHFAKTIRAVRDRLPPATIEVLTPDFQGVESAVETVLDAGPDVFNHNIETVQRLYSEVRPQADYTRSLGVLACAKRRASDDGVKLFTKSGMMVGLGETNEEILEVMRDLRGVGCDILTIGQYLTPSPKHVPIARFVEPVEFDALRIEALEMGFSAVAAGPFVRSSYRAEEVFDERTPR